MTTFFAGLDWASRTHAVCVIDEHGSVCEQFEINHDAAAWPNLCRRLRASARHAPWPSSAPRA